jgi:hypothetical protein
MVQKYLSIPHEYGRVDCITLIRDFYKNELNLDFMLPEYPHSQNWMKKFTTQSVDDAFSKYSVKVNLTEIKNYDVIAFKSNRLDLIIHFGMYLVPHKLLHIEYGGKSRIDNLSSYWIDYIHGIYRHEQMV